MAFDMNCNHCDKPFAVPKYRLATAKYCSRKCQALANRTQIKTNCQICGKEFEHISSRCNKAKYCSRRCYHKAQYLKGSVEYICRHCSKRFRGSPSHKRKYCSKACVNKAGREIWKPRFSTVRKTMVRRKMINECARCGFKTFPKILGIHHKDRNRLNNELNNLEVLCPNCHSIEHAKHIVSHD